MTHNFEDNGDESKLWDLAVIEEAREFVDQVSVRREQMIDYGLIAGLGVAAVSLSSFMRGNVPTVHYDAFMYLTESGLEYGGWSATFVGGAALAGSYVQRKLQNIQDLIRTNGINN